MTTVSSIQAFLDTMDVTEEKNRSALHGFRDTVNRVQNFGVVEDDPMQRAFVIQSATVYQILDPRADQMLREGLRQRIPEMDFEQHGEDIQSMLLGEIDNLEYKHCILPKSRDVVDVRAVGASFERVDEKSEAFASLMAEAIRPEIVEIDTTIREQIRSTYSDIAEVVPPEPTESDWMEVWHIMNETMAELDEDIRYMGDL